MKRACDHIIAVIPRHTIVERSKIEITIKSIKIRSSEYIKTPIFNDEKFTFCPDCGEKINWEALEEALAQCS